MLTAFMIDVQAKARRKVCDACLEKGNTFGVDTCKKCGCVLSFKTKLTDAECPLGKWNDVKPTTATSNSGAGNP